MKYSKEFTKPDFHKHRYPFSVVWTPLPLISAFLPFIGHTGICSQEGVIHDFSGPYTITIDNMAFGNPTKYVPLPGVSQDWDEAVKGADQKYLGEMHNLFTNNCHSHVAYALNLANYEGKHWNMVSVWWMCITRSKYVGFSGFFKTYFQFFVIATIFLIIVLLSRG